MQYRNYIMAKIIFICCFLLFIATCVYAGLTVDGDVVYDNANNLTWAKDANYLKTQDMHSSDRRVDFLGRTDWRTANSYAESLSLGGSEDWRLPADVEEFQSLTSQDGWESYFDNVIEQPYWTADREGRTRTYWSYSLVTQLGSLVNERSSRAVWFVSDGSVGNIYKVADDGSSYFLLSGETYVVAD